jgi:hypothetical protein
MKFINYHFLCYTGLFKRENLERSIIFAQAPSYQLIAHLAKKLRKKRVKAADSLDLSARA